MLIASGESDAIEHYVNHGMLVRNLRAPAFTPKTIIVTGLARSGTSMVARLLSAGGVFMGEVLDDIVFEDHDIASSLEQPTNDELRRLIEDRNQRHHVWGFKRPHLHHVQDPEMLSLFEGAVAIVTHRDPVAIAVRNRVSEQLSQDEALRSAVTESALMMEFVIGLSVPTLMVSYEKALLNRVHFVDTIISFCGLSVPPCVQAQMLSSIEPDRSEYLTRARRRFEGYVDYVEKGVLHGWCREVGSNEAVLLDILVDQQHVASTLANVFRPDLLTAGHGSGEHGFAADIGAFLHTGGEEIEVVVHGRIFRLIDPRAD